MIDDRRLRDMTDYAAKYAVLPFESIQLQYRRKLVLREIRRLSPKRVLEIGCGELPLFTDLDCDVEITVLEPASDFALKARQLSKGRDHVQIIQSYVEEFEPSKADFDVVVLSSVLHEVSDPAAMLAAVRRLCVPSTVLHVVVPNARSLHRLLAVAMGLIPQPDVQSDTQRIMQQRATIYDFCSLNAELAQAGFEVVESGSLFVKPFTHGQMQQLVNGGFMTREMLDGWDRLIEFLPELGSEIWANARIIS